MLLPGRSAGEFPGWPARFSVAPNKPQRKDLIHGVFAAKQKIRQVVARVGPPASASISAEKKEGFRCAVNWLCESQKKRL